mgnify:CR=1 FL=1
MKLKSLIHNKLIQYIIAFIIVFYIKLVRLTSKTTYINTKNIADSNDNMIFAFWHGRELMLTSYLGKYGKIFSVVSLHKDGDLVTIILKLFHSKIFRGSSTKGGLSVLRNIFREFRKPNHHLCITPDGPRGPRMKISGAVIDIAKLSGTKIIPVGCSAKKAKFLNSWDAFMIPRLFNHITVEFGEAIIINKNTSEEQLEIAKQSLEDSLNNIIWNLDKNYGRKKIKPGKIKQKNDTNI